MVQIKIKELENFDLACRKFKRACEKADVSTRFKQSLFYEKPTTKKRRLKKLAMKSIYNSYRASIVRYKG